MCLVHDVDDLWFVVYDGYLYTRDLQSLGCSRCDEFVRAAIEGNWIVRICQCMVVCCGFWDDEIDLHNRQTI